jgi:cobalt-zinc-cadmium efflux system membrane fusion protein
MRLNPDSRKRINFLRETLALTATLAVVGCEPERKIVEETGAKVDGAVLVFPTNSPQSGALTVQTAASRLLAVTHLTGRLCWGDDTTVRVFTPVGGRVQAVLADLGQSVEAGMPLAQIDSPDFGQALADARSAEANFRLAEKTFDRSSDLFAHGAVAQKDLEGAEALRISSRAEWDRARSRLALYGGGTNGSFTLRSPLGGVLVERNISPGQELRSDQMLANAPNLFAPLFVVTDPSRLWLQLDVAELDLSALKSGQQLQIFSQAFPGRAFDGTVDKIGEELDPTTRVVKVRGVVRNPEHLLKAEMYVTVDVVASKPAGVEISAQAVFLREQAHYVFIEESLGRYLRRKIRVGAEQGGKVLVLEGLTEGQRVVVEGALLLEAQFQTTRQP